MKINKNSWHYKMNYEFSERLPKTLCSYFWTTVIRTLLLLVFSAAILTTLIILISPLALLFDIKHPMQEVSFSIYGLMFALFLCLFIGAKVENYKRNKYLIRPYKKPNILWDYLKAKKEKVCPFLEFED